MAWKSNRAVGFDSPTVDSEHETLTGDVRAKYLSRLDIGDIGGVTRAETPGVTRWAVVEGGDGSIVSSVLAVELLGDAAVAISSAEADSAAAFGSSSSLMPNGSEFNDAAGLFLGAIRFAIDLLNKFSRIKFSSHAPKPKRQAVAQAAAHGS